MHAAYNLLQKNCWEWLNFVKNGLTRNVYRVRAPMTNRQNLTDVLFPRHLHHNGSQHIVSRCLLFDTARRNVLCTPRLTTWGACTSKLGKHTRHSPQPEETARSNWCSKTKINAFTHDSLSHVIFTFSRYTFREVMWLQHLNQFLWSKQSDYSTSVVSLTPFFYLTPF